MTIANCRNVPVLAVALVVATSAGVVGRRDLTAAGEPAVSGLVVGRLRERA